MDITQQPQQCQQQQSRMDCDEDEEGRDVNMQSEAVSGEQQGQGRATASSRKSEATDGRQHQQQEQQEPKLSIVNRYVLHGKIDRGTFSTVSLASLRSEQHLPPGKRRMYAIKLITPTSHPLRIEREILCMKRMGGRCNVVGIVDGFRHQGSVGLVMPYIPHEPFHQYYGQLTPAEVQRYLRQLLIALERVHQHGVIHRDVKPSNFLCSPANGGTYVLVDFGLAQETTSGSLSLHQQQEPDPKTEGGAGAAAAAPCSGVKREDQVVPQQTGTIVVRNPLKQQQGANYSHQSPLKLSNSMTNDLADVPLVRQVKSAAATIGSGLLQKHHRRSAALLTAGQRSPYAKDLKRDGSGTTGGCCGCYGRPQVCNRCLVRREMVAPRAGTPGYRPPEVLLKYPHQTTAVDVWAAGVIFLSLLGKVYPFFSNTDDLTSLAQIIEVFGYERLRDTARALDRTLLIHAETTGIKPLSLRSLCQHFRAIYRRREMGSGGTAEDDGAAPVGAGAGGSSPPATGRDEESYGGCSNCCKPPHACLCLDRDGGKGADGTDCDEYGADAYDLLGRLLEPNPHRRITAAEALQHPYFQVQY
uniref:non-specific serine/threonine protein kinase n=1 Tax=Anopheles dirus TaxID=7168 RepID=A0A182N6A1_9DIPT